MCRCVCVHIGCLYIRAYGLGEARELPFSADTFVLVESGGARNQTEVQRSSAAPVWDHLFTLRADFKPGVREELVATGIPWAIRTGGDCEDLLCVYYEEHLERPLKDVQGELGIVPYRGGEK